MIPFWIEQVGQEIRMAYFAISGANRLEDVEPGQLRLKLL